MRLLPTVSRWLFAATLLATLSANVGCSSNDATEDEAEPAGEMTQDELRTKSDDLFKPTSAPVQIVPATYRYLVNWELYTNERGTTIIGRSKTKKAKAIFVQLVDPKRDASGKDALRGSGYLVASDFRLDANDKQNELRLLAEVIKKDFDAALAKAEIEVPIAPATDPVSEPAKPTTEPDKSVPAPPAPVTKTEPAVPKECVRTAMKRVVFGLDVLKSAATTIWEGYWCAADEKSDCSAAVASFKKTVAIVQDYDARTCK